MTGVRLGLRRLALLGAAAGLVAAMAQGCKGDDDDDGGGKAKTGEACFPATGRGAVSQAKAAAMGDAAGVFIQPLDATPSPNGCDLYFTAMTPEGTPAVFRQTGSSGDKASAPARIDQGDLLTSPFSITTSSDGKTIFVADIGASVDEENDGGRVWRLSSEGGTPEAIGEADGLAVRSLTLHKDKAGDMLYFAATGAQGPGVYRMPAGGGAVEAVAAGEAFADPVGVAVSDRGEIFALDTGLDEGTGTILRVSNGRAETVAAVEDVGFPAGITVASDGSAVMISTKGAAVRHDLQTGEQAKFQEGIADFIEPAGLHRAVGSEVYAWVDSLANGQGTLFLIWE
jgi:sugar lactone lactonase YvrE